MGRLKGMKVRKTEREGESTRGRRKRRKMMGKSEPATRRDRVKGRQKREGRRGEWRPPTAATEIFYELNCAGGLCPRESMCEDQTPRRKVLVYGWW